MKKALKFPKKFFWGTSTASHQVEGGNYNNWSEWEKLKSVDFAHSSHRKFGYLSNWKNIKKEAENPKNYISGKAVDHFNRYPEDFDIMKSLGLNAYRFSIEWSRIEPEKGRFNKEALAHYVLFINELKVRGIEPFVTLWHWSHPVWLEKEGGILARNFSKYFVRYARYVVEALQNDVNYWLTINEPEIFTYEAYMAGSWPPGKRNVLSTLRARLALMMGHNKVYNAIKRINSGLKVSFAKHEAAFEVGDNSILTKISVSFGKYIASKWFFIITKGHLDFIGVNHYARTKMKAFSIANDNEVVGDLGWELYPKSIYMSLMELKRFKKPIIITENGVADAEDKYRSWFIKETLRWLHKAIEEGVDVKGYLHWSLLDNFEWDKGFWPKFGLVKVNRKNQKRTIRKSAYLYGKVAKANKLEVDE
ncbi:glycoside hydrolase family 1 protein [bacterium]|nr:glycoside hydrolase family 1 protein [bacterium]